MQFTNTGQQLFTLIEHNLENEIREWISDKLHRILEPPTARELFLTYTLMGSKINPSQTVDYPQGKTPLISYLKSQEANLLEISRIYLLVRVLEENSEFFTPKVAQLIQVADTGELVTFLRFLAVLPNAGDFKHVGVEALRTNIATVFDAISKNNPYPSLHFNEQQWNQMYLKAAFMQRDLNAIVDIEERANKDLARIISDYAHERWAASREVDPLFWRPVSNFIEGPLLEDMSRLLQSDSETENKAGALCCYSSSQAKAKALLNNYPGLMEGVKQGEWNWNTLKT